MSVYTCVSTAELEIWLSRYALGAVREFLPIAAGIENTNYFLTTDRRRFVLTLYERTPPDELPFYLNLMAHLAREGVPCPAPVSDRTGALFSLLKGKPASIATRLAGRPVERADAPHCAAVGAALARLHLASVSYRDRLSNRRGVVWSRQAARAVRPFLNDSQWMLLATELQAHAALVRPKLPKAAIHGDLFCDNVLFDGATLSGIIDFGFAATDFLAYDLAITVNDWCIVTTPDAYGELDSERVVALLSNYCRLREMSNAERTAWPALMRAAALRFWLSRLYDFYLPRVGAITHAHDPMEFERILRCRSAAPARFPNLNKAT